MPEREQRTGIFLLDRSRVVHHRFFIKFCTTHFETLN